MLLLYVNRKRNVRLFLEVNGAEILCCFGGGDGGGARKLFCKCGWGVILCDGASLWWWSKWVWCGSGCVVHCWFAIVVWCIGGVAGSGVGVDVARFCCIGSEYGVVVGVWWCGLMFCHGGVMCCRGVVCCWWCWGWRWSGGGLLCRNLSTWRDNLGHNGTLFTLGRKSKWKCHWN